MKLREAEDGSVYRQAEDNSWHKYEKPAPHKIVKGSYDQGSTPDIIPGKSDIYWSVFL